MPKAPLVVAGLWRSGSVELVPEEEPAGPGRWIIHNQTLILAPQSSLEESSVTLNGSSGLQAWNAELRDVELKAGSGNISLRNSVLSNLGITKLGPPKPTAQPPGPPNQPPNTPPNPPRRPQDPFAEKGPTVDISECLVTGRLEMPLQEMGGFPSSITRCHFVRTTFVKPPDRGPGSRFLMTLWTIRSSHFEKCELPLSMVLGTMACTFEDCRFVDDLSPAKENRKFILSRVGPPGEGDSVPAKQKIEVKSTAEPAWRFWSPWQPGAKDGVTTEHRIAFGPVVTGPCEPLPPDESGETTAASVEGAVFRARGTPLLLRVSKGIVEKISKGFTRTGGAANFSPGGRLTWTEAAGPQSAWFMNSGRQLIMGATVFDRTDPAPREGAKAPAAATDENDPTGWLAGSAWEFPAKGGKQWLRFESSGSYALVDAGGVRSAGLAWPVRGGGGIFVRDWPSGGKGILVTWDAGHNVSFTRDGGVVSGIRLDPGPAGVFAALTPPGAPQPKPEEMAGNPAGTIPEADAAAAGGKADPAGDASGAPSAMEKLFKARTSTIGALFSATTPQSELITTASGYRITATARSVDGGFESPLVYAQYPGFISAQKPVKKMLTERFTRWPSGGEIQLSHSETLPTPAFGGSVMLPAALLMEGLYTGVEWDPEFCVTGKLTDGNTVMPVKGIVQKLAAARLINGRIAAVPFGNERQVRDYMLSEGPGALVSMQVIGVANYGEAVALARKNRTGKIQTAVSEFRKITGAAPSGPAMNAWLKTAPVQAQLAKVLAAEPHHLSAGILLDWAQGKATVQFSPITSALEIQRVCGDSVLGIGIYSNSVDPFAPTPPAMIAELKEVLSALNKLRPRCSPEHRDLVGRLITYGNQRMELLTKKKPNPLRTRPRDFDKDPAQELSDRGNQLSIEISRLGRDQAGLEY
ncbi:MAG: hypothetical protein V4726_06715 [Verrucomicrobiota bacterium]